MVWAMLEGVRNPVSGKLEKSKDIENRHGRLCPGWYGVILGKSTTGVLRERYEETRRKLVGCPIPPFKWDSKQYMGCVVGVVHIAHSLPLQLCKDSCWASGPICNIISHAGWIGRPIPSKGNLGACPIQDPEALRKVREYADIAFREGEILETGAEKRFPCLEASVWAAMKKSSNAIDLRDKYEVGNLRDFLVTSAANTKRKREELDQEGQNGVTNN